MADDYDGGGAGEDFDDDYQEADEPEELEGIEEGDEDETNDQEQVEILASGTPGVGEGVDPSKRVTTPYMTKYERARVLGTRALQVKQPTRVYRHFCRSIY